MLFGEISRSIRVARADDEGHPAVGGHGTGEVREDIGAPFRETANRLVPFIRWLPFAPAVSWLRLS
jgi:hypothetical protein